MTTQAAALPPSTVKVGRSDVVAPLAALAASTAFCAAFWIGVYALLA